MMEEKDPKGVSAELTEEEAKALLTERIPPEIRAEYGGFVRAFNTRFRDNRACLFITLERGYFIQFTRSEEEAKARGVVPAYSLYLSPEMAYAFALLYALFGARDVDELRFWDSLAEDQRALIDEVLGGVRDPYRSPATAEAGCSKACYGAEVCANGWPDGSCGAKPQGTARPPQLAPEKIDPDACIEFTQEELTRDDSEAIGDAVGDFPNLVRCTSCGLPTAIHSGVGKCPPESVKAAYRQAIKGGR